MQGSRAEQHKTKVYWQSYLTEHWLYREYRFRQKLSFSLCTGSLTACSAISHTQDWISACATSSLSSLQGPQGQRRVRLQRWARKPSCHARTLVIKRHVMILLVFILQLSSKTNVSYVSAPSPLTRTSGYATWFYSRGAKERILIQTVWF